MLFHFTVDAAAEAVATWEFEIIRSATGGGNALLVGGLTLSAAATGENQMLVIESEVSLVNSLASKSFQIPFSNGGTFGDLVISSVTPGGVDGADVVIDAVSAVVGPGASGAIHRCPRRSPA